MCYLSHTLLFSLPFAPPSKGNFHYTPVPVSVKGKKEVFLPPSGCYRRDEARGTNDRPARYFLSQLPLESIRI
jgi:hypothetical protein